MQAIATVTSRSSLRLHDHDVQELIFVEKVWESAPRMFEKEHKPLSQGASYREQWIAMLQHAVVIDAVVRVQLPVP
jgi:hypothetical protein